LSTVQDRQNDATHLTAYTYDDSSQHILTIQDANHHAALTLTYDGPGRVATQTDAQTAQTTFEPYNAASSCPTGITGSCTATTVTYPANSLDAKAMTVVDTYNAQGQLVQSSPADLSVRWP
jgi:YD repeat-containing protein